MIQIGKDIHIEISEYKGKEYVNIRRWYEADGELKPSNKGISLKMEEWAEFVEKFDGIQKDITEAVEK